MNHYQRHSVTRVSVACSMVLFAAALLSQPSFAQSISGNPASRVEVGELYRFIPTVRGLRDDRLRFSVSGKPNWLSFDRSTGQLKGRPGNSAVGRHGNISLRVTDGRNSATLPAFSVDVVREGAPDDDPEPDPGDGPPDDGPPDDGPPDDSGGDPDDQSGARISGSPESQIEVGDLYSFTPSVSGLRANRLRFSVRSKPNWLNFDRETGRLRGRPGRSAVGRHENISVRVTDGRDSATLDPFTVEVFPEGGAPADDDPGGGSGGANQAPTISGTPPAAVLEGSEYSFTPNASDADGDSLSFSVDGLPTWASFDRNNGRLRGTPSATDVGVYGSIVITVSDGQNSASLGPFEIAVTSRGDASVTLEWTPPTRNTDGTLLRDLAAYRIDWGQDGGSFTNSVTVSNPGLTRYVIEDLTPGQYMFAVAAVNSAGVASERSNISRRTVN